MREERQSSGQDRGASVIYYRGMPEDGESDCRIEIG